MKRKQKKKNLELRWIIIDTSLNKFLNKWKNTRAMMSLAQLVDCFLIYDSVELVNYVIEIESELVFDLFSHTRVSWILLEKCEFIFNLFSLLSNDDDQPNRKYSKFLVCQLAMKNLTVT